MPSPNVNNTGTLSGLLSPLEDLSQQCRSHQILLRVHSPISASPLIWTGELASSGFSTPNSHLAGISPSIYHSTYSVLSTFENPPIQRFKASQVQPASTLIPGPYLRHTLVDHISEKVKQTCIPLLPTVEESQDGLFEDEKTPWISASSEAFWCLWEVARRLALLPGEEGGEEQVELAIMRHPFLHQQELASAQEEGKEKDAGHEVTEFYAMPAQHIRPTYSTGEMSLNQREIYESARKAAVTSGEVLFFGRVFAQNVLANHVFTRNATPFPLPAQCLKTLNTRSSTSMSEAECSSFVREWHKSREASSTYDQQDQSWLDTLVWDPRTDEYPAAREKVISRRRELGHQGLKLFEPM